MYCVPAWAQLGLLGLFPLPSIARVEDGTPEAIGTRTNKAESTPAVRKRIRCLPSRANSTLPHRGVHVASWVEEAGSIPRKRDYFKSKGYEHVKAQGNLPQSARETDLIRFQRRDQRVGDHLQRLARDVARASEPRARVPR